MIFSIDTDGVITCIYTENIDLNELGSVTTKRGSHVEPANNNSWYCDLSPLGHPVFDGFRTRTAALEFEVDYIEKNIL
jgi:hypothetical protein